MAELHLPRLADIRTQDHTCCLCEDREEVEQTVLSLARQQARQDGCLLYVSGEPEKDALRRQLAAEGVCVLGAEELGPGVCCCSPAGSLASGAPGLGQLLAGLGEALQKVAPSPAAPLTILLDIACFTPQPASLEWLSALETGLDSLTAEGVVGVVCLYDASRLGPPEIMAGMAGHPVVILDGLLHDNLYYSPRANGGPEVLLQHWLSSLREMRTTRHSLTRALEFTSTVLNQAGALIVVLDHEGRIVRFNRMCEEVTGWTAAEAEGRLLWEFLLREEEAPAVRGVFDHLVADRLPSTFENYWCTRDGDQRLIDWRNAVLLGPEGQVEWVVAAGKDVTEERAVRGSLLRLTRVYAMLSQINEAMVRVREPEKLYEAACRIAVEEGGYALAWVGLWDPGTGRVRPVARAGQEASYLEAINISTAAPPNERGPVGTSVLEGLPQVRNDLEHHTAPGQWRLEALRRGFRSAAALPLRRGAVTTGVFALYADRPEVFSAEEIDQLEGLADNLSYAVEALQHEALRRAAERAYRASEETARALLNANADASLLISADGLVLAANEAATRHLGRSGGEVVGRGLYDLLPAELAQSRRERVAEVVRTGRPLLFLEEHDGRVVSNQLYPIGDELGEVRRVGLYSRDITAERQAQARIEHLHSVLRAIRNVNQLITREKNRSALLQGACEALTEGRGYTEAWLALRTPEGGWGEVYGCGLGPVLEQLRAALQAGNAPPCVEGVLGGQEVLIWSPGEQGCTCRLRDEELCGTRMSLPVRHEAIVYGLLTVNLSGEMVASKEEESLLEEMVGDIGLALRSIELAEAQQQAAQDLALERDRLEALLKLQQMTGASLQEWVDFALEEAVRLTGSRIGYIAFASEDETVLTMYSWSKTAMQECAIADKPIVYPVDQTGLWGEAIRQRRPVVTNDYQALNPLKKGIPEGHVAVQRHLNIPVFDGEQIVAVAGVGNKESNYEQADIRQLTLLMDGLWRHIQRQRTEEELRELNDSLERKVQERTRELQRSNEELEQFAYIASHDLQEPLRMVSSYVQLLARRYEGKLDQDAEDFIGFAVDGATRMSELIQDLLQYSRVGTQGKPPAPTDLGQVVLQAQANLQAAIEESGATITWEELPVVEGDEAQLIQVMQNLLSNALKFRGSEPPRVQISARASGETWEIDVQDNGIGLDMAYASRIFVIFQRLHTRDDYPGSGMGLAICQKIIKRHGGHLSVSSAPGQGATFTIKLPRK